MSESQVSPLPGALEAIRASAGSGKTYALTTRYLGILGGEEPDGILATTFTRKAAGEILGRVLRRLAEAANDEQSCRQLAADLRTEGLTQPECQKRLARLCRSLHRVSISTLDSFFTRLSTSFRHELDMPADGQVLEPESPAAVALREKAIQALMKEAGAAQLVAWLEPLQEGMARRAVQSSLDELFRELYDVYRQTAPEAWCQLLVPPDADEAELQAALSALAAAAGELSWKQLTTAIDKDLVRVGRGDWAGLLASGIAPKVLDGSLLYYRKELPESVVAPYEVLIRRARAVLLQRTADQTQATFGLLREFDRHYTAVRQQQRSLLFSDVPRALAQVMPGRRLEEIAYRMDTRIDHLLLDEFQDTSPEQWQVLRPFASRIHEISSMPASIFCVGDVKQAIYSWRGGCAEIFNRLGQDLQRVTWRSMDDSYRSAQVVLDAVHAVFSALEGNPALGEHQAAGALWQARYERHTAKRQLPGYVELATYPGVAPAGDGGDEEDEAAPDALVFAAQRIAEITTEAPFATIGVLLRTNAAVRQMLFHLQQSGVTASGEGGSPVDDVPEVEVILSALMFADHPGDTAAAYRLSASPLRGALGFNPGELPSPRQRARASRRLRRQLVTRGYPEVLGEWTRQLAVSADERGAIRLTQLMELADIFAREPGLRPAEFVRFVRGTPVEEPSPARVRVMSIHRAKGLEFDVVVLPELQKRVGQVRGALMVDQADPTGPIQAVFRSGSELVRSLSPQLTAAHARQQSAEVQESLCLLYVAMTRARHALYLVVPPLQQNRSGAARKEALSYASILRAALRSPELNEGFAGGELLFRAGDPEWMHACSWPPDATGSPIGTPALRLAPSGSGRRTLREVTPSSLEGDGKVRAADLLSLTADEGQQYGTLMHAWLALVGWAGDPLPSDEELLRIAARIVPENSLEWRLARLVEWKETLRDPRVTEQLTRPSGCEVDLWREQRFAVHLGETLLHGAFDRVEIRRSGPAIQAVELIDYKTDRVEPAAIAVRTEVYRPQMLAYRQGLASMLRIDPALIRARLLFVQPRLWVEVTAV